MDHAEFVRKWNEGKLAIHVDQPLAVRAVGAGLLLPGYQAAQNFYGWLRIIGFLAAIPLMIWYIWWVGLILLIIALMLPAAIKRTAAEGVRDEIIKDATFYNFARERGLVRVTERE